VKIYILNYFVIYITSKPSSVGVILIGSRNNKTIDLYSDCLPIEYIRSHKLLDTRTLFLQNTDRYKYFNTSNSYFRNGINLVVCLPFDTNIHTF